MTDARRHRIPCVGCRKWIQLGRDRHHFNTQCVDCDARSLGTTPVAERRHRTRVGRDLEAP